MKIRIHSLAYMIALPFGIIMAALMYYIFFEYESHLFYYAIPILVVLIALYTYHPDIDFWWHMKHPPKLNRRIVSLLQHTFPYYNSLDVEYKTLFENRLSILMHSKAFYIMIKEKTKMPFDMSALYAAPGVVLTLGQKSFIYPDHDYFIAYQHPFPSPLKQFLHSCEYNEDDRVLIMDSQSLVNGLRAPKKHFNVGQYGWALVYLNQYAPAFSLQIDLESIKKMEPATGMKLDDIERSLGYFPESLVAVSIVLYFTFPEEFRSILPSEFQILSETFNNPDISLPSKI